MKKIFIALTVAVPTIAEVPPRAAIDMMVDMAQQREDFYATADCLDISKKNFLNSYLNTVDDCYEDSNVRQAADFMAAFEACIKPRMLRKLDRTQGQVDVCNGPEEKLMQRAEALERKVRWLRGQHEALYEKTELSVADRQRLDTLEQQIAGVEEQQFQLEDELVELSEYERETDAVMEDAGLSPAQRQPRMALEEAELAGRAANASLANLDRITLPVYTNSKIMMHAANAGTAGQAGQLPAATFASPDTPQQVLAFYRRLLPDFTYKELPGGEHILMETMPESFAILSHMQIYYATPHVLIRTDAGQPGRVPAGTKSFIEIAYRR